jgi:hypothetical protein
MPFRRNDFHNSRAYEADPVTSAPRGLSIAIAWVKRQFDKLLRSGASSSISTVTLFDKNEGPYSLLGADGRDRSSRMLERTVFPMADREIGAQTKLRRATANRTGRHEHHTER